MRRMPEMPERSKAVSEDAPQTKINFSLAAGCLQREDITSEGL